MTPLQAGAGWPTLGRNTVLRSKRCRSTILFEISLLPYQAPRFDAINDSHYRPAFDEAMRLKRADIDAIIAHRAAPDFDNTVLALEKRGHAVAREQRILRHDVRTH